jgi:hypothetical protein
MKNEEKLKEERLAELLKKADDHPIMKKILAEEADKILEARLLAAAKLRALGEEAAAIIPEREADLAAREAELAKYDEERKVILGKLLVTRTALAQERGRLDRERAAAETILLGNYDPKIDETILFFRDTHEALRVKGINKQNREGEVFVNEKKEMTTYTNAPAIKDALAYCRATTQELEKMKLTPALDLERIEKLKKGIPDADALTEYTAIVKTTQNNLLPRQSSHDWKISRLLKR